jgi:hypothetical protein
MKHRWQDIIKLNKKHKAEYSVMIFLFLPIINGWMDCDGFLHSLILIDHILCRTNFGNIKISTHFREIIQNLNTIHSSMSNKHMQKCETEEKMNVAFLSILLHFLYLRDI